MTNRDQILRNTAALFLERGCKSVTMDEVASVNGMSKRTIYELFQDKARLLQECIILMHRDNMNRSENELAKTDNVLEWFMHSLENKDEQRMSFFYDFFTEVKRYYPEVFVNVVKDVNRWHCGLLERIIERGQAEGLFITGILAIIWTSSVTVAETVLCYFLSEVSLRRKDANISMIIWKIINHCYNNENTIENNGSCVLRLCFRDDCRRRVIQGRRSTAVSSGCGYIFCDVFHTGRGHELRAGA